MAETAAAIVIKKISDFLVEEALKQGISLVCGEVSKLKLDRAKFEAIRDELDMMRAFLLDAEHQAEDSSNSEDSPRAWIRKVRNVALEAEDVVDEFSYLFSKHRRRRGCRAFLHRNLFPKPRLDLSNKLEMLESRLRSLSEMKERYGVRTTHEGGTLGDANRVLEHVAEAAFFMQEDEVVGFEKNRSTITQWLIDDDDEAARLKMISVWGMGGLGKTTLVSQVYKSPAVREHFTVRAWVSVSQTYQADDLLRRLIKQVLSPEMGVSEESIKQILNQIGAMGYSELVDRLRNLLRGKRYLAVIDDVWDVSAWRMISTAFIDENCGSRIVFTSRIYDVSQLAARNRDMQLEPLQDEDAWTLFCKKAFIRNPSRSCPSQLESWARKIVDKCQGLPLAITTLGSMMSLRGESQSEWSRIYEDLSWELMHRPELEKMNRILTLSLKELPEHLRRCLLFCSAFPEDFLIDRKKLIRLLVAEGLVEGRDNRTMEELAEDYLNQLVYRCMLQVATRNNSGRVKQFRMHDLLHALIVSISKKNLWMIYDNPGAEFVDGVRHLAMQSEPTTSDIRLWKEKPVPRLRSFLVRSPTPKSWTSSLSLLSGLSSTWKLLRVLDLQDLPLESLPEAVFDLFNLCHLGLRGTNVKRLSNSVKRLENLLTLDLFGAKLRELPHGVTKLKKLRHLFVTGFDATGEFFVGVRTVPAPRGLWNLMDLQTLKAVEADDEIVRHLHNLTKLRTLWITNVRNAHCKQLCAALKGMTKLQRLSIWATEAVELEGLSPPPPFLYRLGLVAQLEGGRLPPWLGNLGSLANLTFLELDGCQLSEDEDPLRPLEGSPTLAYLGLYNNAYLGPRLCFRAGCFSKLKKLNLSGLSQLRGLEIRNGALPSLKYFQLHHCQELKQVPQGIQYLTALQEFLLSRVPTSVIERLLEDPSKVRHISSIGYVSWGDDGRPTWVDVRKLMQEKEREQERNDEENQATSAGI